MKKNPKSVEWLCREMDKDTNNILSHKQQLISSIKSLEGKRIGNSVQKRKTKQKQTLWERLMMVILGH